MLGHAFAMNQNSFFLPAFTETNNMAQCSFCTSTFEFAPNVKAKKKKIHLQDLDYFGTRV